MQFKEPKNTDKISWTKHSIEKMKFYGLTPQRVMRVLKSPERCEQGVAEGCTACMQTLGAKRKTELWAMYIDVIKNNPLRPPALSRDRQSEASKKHRKIITAWRYPGVSPIREKIPIPEDILEEVMQLTSNN